MLTGKEATKIFNKFVDPIKGSPVCQMARVSVEMPSGELFDVYSQKIKLLELVKHTE